MTIGDDFKILSDKTTDGVRHITEGAKRKSVIPAGAGTPKSEI